MKKKQDWHENVLKEIISGGRFHFFRIRKTSIHLLSFKLATKSNSNVAGMYKTFEYLDVEGSYTPYGAYLILENTLRTHVSIVNKLSDGYQ